MKTSFNSGISQVTIGVGSMIKGMLGAQAVIAGIQKLTGAIRQGVNTAIDFEAANSKLAAILGTTKGEIKDLTADARRLEKRQNTPPQKRPTCNRIIQIRLLHQLDS